MSSQSFYAAAASVIPLLLLTLAARERLATVRDEWLKGGRLHLISVLLAAMVVAEVLALGSLRRDEVPFGVDIFILVTIACALGLVTWGLGWSIWQDHPDLVPGDRTWGKKAYYGIGLVTLVALAVASYWALT